MECRRAGLLAHNQDNGYRIPTWKVLETDGDGNATYESIHLSYQEYLCSVYLTIHEDRAKTLLGSGIKGLKDAVEKQPNMMTMFDAEFLNRVMFTGDTLNLDPLTRKDGLELATCLGGILSINQSFSTMQMGQKAYCSEAGWKTIFDGCKDNMHLRNIDMTACNSTVAAAVGRMLRENHGVTSLDVHSNTRIAPHGWAALCKGLARNTSIRKLNCRGCKISAMTAGHVAHALSRNATIESVDMSRNSVTPPEGWQEMFIGLGSNVGPVEVNLARYATCGAPPRVPSGCTHVAVSMCVHAAYHTHARLSARWVDDAAYVCLLAPHFKCTCFVIWFRP